MTAGLHEIVRGGGLLYQGDPTLGILYYEPAGPFVVDGIRYDFNAQGGNHPRLMVELFSDHRCVNLPGGECSNESVLVTPSQPPTEADLDRYVRTGALPPRRVCGWADDD